ncbi:MAG TPA: glycosyltransferase [Sphingobacteriaceae bacterium]
MKITILTLGTRGDVQPYAVLGQALAQRGHQITLSTAKNFKELVESYGIAFHPIDADYEQLLNSKEGKRIFNGNPFALKRNFNKLISPIIERSLNEFYNLAQASDVTIYRPKTLANVFTNQLSKITIQAAVVPAMIETAAFPNPAISGFKIPEFLYKWSYRVNDLKYSILKKPIKSFHLQNGLNEEFPIDSAEACVYGISPYFLNRPDDWPLNHYLTGFWFSEQNTGLPPDVERFIAEGKAPIVVTFGSMPLPRKLNKLILRAAEELNQRFIIVKGWGDLDVAELSNRTNIRVVDPMPFEALFKKAKAVVHHGGIGTVAECLRSGIPMFICPAVYPLGDQFFWGDLAHRKGVAVKPIPLSKLHSNEFIESIHELLTNKTLYQKSAEMASRLRAENGVRKAADHIERIISEKTTPSIGPSDNANPLTQIAS